jgi:predicted ester cyclase
LIATHLETVRAYWDASDRADWESAGRCIGEGYIWVDHTLGDEPTDLNLALEEAQAWSDQRFEITRVHEATDGTLIVLATVTRALTGPWRSVEPAGQRVRSNVCVIFRFNDEGLIVYEEQYEDALSVMRQLGAIPR